MTRSAPIHRLRPCRRRFSPSRTKTSWGSSSTFSIFFGASGTGRNLHAGSCDRIAEYLLSGRPAGRPRSAGLPQVGDEPGRVIPLVGTQRQPPGRSGGMAMDHVQRAQFMTVGLGQHPARQIRAGFPSTPSSAKAHAAHEAQHSVPGDFKAFRIGTDRGMRRVRSLSPLKSTNCGGGGLAGHRCLCWVCPGWVVGGGILCGRISSGGAPSARGWKLFIDAQALINEPSTEKCCPTKRARPRMGRIAAITLRAISVVSTAFSSNPVDPEIMALREIPWIAHSPRPEILRPTNHQHQVE